MPSNIAHAAGQVTSFEGHSSPQQPHSSSLECIQQNGSDILEMMPVYSMDSKPCAEDPQNKPKASNVSKTKASLAEDPSPSNSEVPKSNIAEIKLENNASPEPLEPRKYQPASSSDFSLRSSKPFEASQMNLGSQPVKNFIGHHQWTKMSSHSYEGQSFSFPRSTFSGSRSFYPTGTDNCNFQAWEKPHLYKSYGGPNELVRGPRATRIKHLPILSVGEGGLNSYARRDNYNKPDFQVKYDRAKFFMIKSFSEDDIHKSIKYSVWASTPNGNNKLDAAFRKSEMEKAVEGTQCPIFLFFSAAKRRNRQRLFADFDPSEDIRQAREASEGQEGETYEPHNDDQFMDIEEGEVQPSPPSTRPVPAVTSVEPVTSTTFLEVRSGSSFVAPDPTEDDIVREMGNVCELIDKAGEYYSDSDREDRPLTQYLFDVVMPQGDDVNLGKRSGYLWAYGSDPLLVAEARRESRRKAKDIAHRLLCGMDEQVKDAVATLMAARANKERASPFVTLPASDSVIKGKAVVTDTSSIDDSLDHETLARRPPRAPISRKGLTSLLQVNASGQFVGLAEMIGPVDFKKSMDFWQQDKWSGFFPVKWHIIKDIPNRNFQHIILEYNDNRAVTYSRDTQEIKLPQGLSMLQIFKAYKLGTSILDDIDFYEEKEKILLAKRSIEPALTVSNVNFTADSSMEHVESSFGNMSLSSARSTNRQSMSTKYSPTNYARRPFVNRGPPLNGNSY